MLRSTPEMSHTSSLHGDGINFSLFHFLWNKTCHRRQTDHLSKSSNNKRSLDKKYEFNSKLSDLRIPDTIILQFGQPLHWYFTSENRGQTPTILRKRKQNLTVDKIEEVFVSKAKRDGIRVEENRDVLAYFISSTFSEDPDGNIASVIEYFDFEALHNFLDHGRREKTGLLQRFIPPQGLSNTLIRAIYTPKLTVLERRKNKLHLHDSRFGLYERAITFEGPDVHSIPSPLRGNVLARKIQDLCEDVVEHVEQITTGGGKIIRMVSNWKVDAKGKIWLLYTTCIRVTKSTSSSFHQFFSFDDEIPSSEPLMNIEPMIKLPKTVHLEQIPNHNRNIVLKNHISTITCPSCYINESKTKFHPIPYKTIIAHFEQVLNLISKRREIQFGDDKNTGWPPDLLTIQSAGGVGFGSIKDRLSESDSSDNQKWSTEEKIIPPVIRHFHNRLKVYGYRRYRHDPLFLHRTCDVCEQCFLSYAELSSTNFQIVEPIRLDLDDIENRRRRDWQQKLKLIEKDLDKDKCVWMPINDEKSSHMNNIKIKGKQNDSVRDFGDIPEFPKAIITSHPDLSNNPINVDDFIKQRERNFFKEIALQGKHAIEGHALSSMISAHAALKQAEKDSSKPKMKIEKNPYEEVLKFVENEPMKVNKCDERRQGKTKLPYPPKKKNNDDIFVMRQGECKIK